VERSTFVSLDLSADALGGTLRDLGFVLMNVWWLKVLRGSLFIAAMALAVVPLAVLLDLSSGGTGYGLCSRGLAGCDTPYTAGPELAAILGIGLFALAGGVRLISRMIRRHERQEQIDDVMTRLGVPPIG
jgi:hypothetical protein